MPRVVTPLTDTKIKNAKPTEKEYTLADGGGLQLRVKPNESKLWVLKYTHPFSSKRTNLGLGKYPDISLKEARVKREEIANLLANKIDPKAYFEKQLNEQKSKLINTFGCYAQKWITLKKQSVKPDTAAKMWSRLENHVLPKLSATPIEDLKPQLVIKTLQPLAAQGKLETVKRICRYINEVMEIGIAGGVLEVNYVQNVTKSFAAPNSKNMATIKPEQLPELMKSIALSQTTLLTKLLLEWQLHTMTRPKEAATARWDEIDIENSLWTIPAEKMKMNRPHTIPLSPQVIELLKKLLPISGHRNYLFPSHRNPNSHVNTQSANMALKRMGYKGTLVSHGLRALASTILNEKGFNYDHIEAALAHKDRNQIRAAYNKAQYIEQRREMMNWWSQHIEEASITKTSQGITKK
ncbi:integrase [Saccharobesus litoralis]|uniref:Integrase n=1 Tax=Saccharobesus litoralis TaxID=2172099 RepID=A0A2S0VW59_9ALTE|nr:integrase domain-containing protein [Saccharobesus litoralis]AWB68456.1 integrase [Saccharobesus litoralis]